MSSAAPPSAAAGGVERAVPQQTTPGDVALHNLSDHIDALERRLKRGCARPAAARRARRTILLSRTSF
jgi:hypothetical protein